MRPRVRLEAAHRALDRLVVVPAEDRAQHRRQVAKQRAVGEHVPVEAHILAVTQAVCEYRKAQGTNGPLFLGKDTHALSDPAQDTALDVLGANSVQVLYSRGATPTPVISHAILFHNRGRSSYLADGLVITPSHNPPTDGGFKYNPTNGGPADTDVTSWVQTVVNGQQPGGSHWTRLALVDDATTGTSETYKEFYAKEANVPTASKPRLVVKYQ